MVQESQLKDIDSNWDKNVLSVFRGKNYQESLPAAINYYRNILTETEKVSRFTTKDWATIMYTVSASAFGILEQSTPSSTLPGDLDCYAVFFEYFKLYITRLEQTPDKSGWFPGNAETLLEDALRLIIRFHPSALREEARHWVNAMKTAWNEKLALKVLKKTLFEVRLESGSSETMQCVQILAELYLEITNEHSDTYRAERSAMMNMLADMVYFFHGYGEQSEEKARALLEESIHINPGDKFAERRLKDITRRQMVDEQIRRFNHDVNNSMGGLLSTLEKLKDMITTENLNPLIEEQVQHIENGLRHIKGIHRFVQDQQPDFSIHRLIDVIKPLQASFPHAQLKITGDLETKVELDSAYLRLALNNLLINAMEAYSRKNIPETERRVDVIIEKTDRFVLMHIKDHAGGIEPSLRMDIFNKYVSSKGIKGKTGLGLYNAREAIERMNGTLEMASQQPESGSHFIITLSD